MYVISVFNIRGTQRKKNPDKARECWQRCCTKKQDEIHVCVSAKGRKPNG